MLFGYDDWLSLITGTTTPAQRQLAKFFAALALGLGIAVAPALPLRASDQVVLAFGPFSRSIPTESLVKFAETGVVDRPLAPFLRRLNGAQREQLRTALTARRAINLVPLSQWFNSPMGNRSLQFLGKLVQTDAGLNGRQALRAAIVAAAAEDGDISVIDIVRNFPTTSLQIDLSQALAIGRQVRAEVLETIAIVDTLRQESRAAATLPPALDLAALPALTQPGPHAIRQVSITPIAACQGNASGFPTHATLVEVWEGDRNAQAQELPASPWGLGGHSQPGHNLAEQWTWVNNHQHQDVYGDVGKG